MSAFYLKDPNDEDWANDPGVQEYFAWMKQDFPGGNPADIGNVYGYCTAQTTVQVLKQCGDDLSRANIMHQPENLNIDVPLLLPGSRIVTSPTDHYPVKLFKMGRFEGQRLEVAQL